MILKLNINDSEDWATINAVCKALSSKKRIRAINVIKENKEVNYKEIAEAINRSPTAVTNHMKWLMNSGLVEVLLTKGERGFSQKTPKMLFDKIEIYL